jgi:hypothetical protein
VLVLESARLRLRPLAFVSPLVPVPAWVLLVVPVFCVAEVVWLVVALGLIVTELCGIALKFASVLTDVLAFGATPWLVVVLVLLPA